MSTKQDKKISYIFAVYFLSSILNKSIKSIFTVNDGTWKMMSLLFAAVIALCMLWCLPYLIQRKLFSFLCAEIFMGILFAVSILRYQYDEIITGNLVTSLVTCIPLGIYSAAIKDKSLMVDSLTRIAPVCVIAGAVACYVSVGIGNNDYSMSLSYSLLLFVSVLFNSYMSDKKIIYLLLVIIGSCVIVIWGSRGPTLILAIFFMLRYFGIRRKMKIKQLIFRILLISVIALAIVFLTDILRFVAAILNRFGFSSRTITLLLNGKYAYSAGRDIIQDYYWGLINKQPVFGYGLSAKWINSAQYPHSIIIETLLYFGYGVGIPLLGFFASRYFKLFSASSNIENPENQLILIFGCYCVSLFMSGSFLVCPEWYIYIALCTSPAEIRFKKR